MRRIEIWACVAGVAVALAWAGPAGAALTPAQKCEKLKNKAAGKRALCTAKQRGKEIAGKPFNYATCTATMSTAFTTYETRAMGACPTTGDAADIEARIDDIFDPSNAIPKALSAVRFVDNGDGTATDAQTGLMWEKKDSLDGNENFANPHDADNYYRWSAASPYEVPSGTAYTDFLNRLNNCSFDGSSYAGGFAGHCDWRLPTEQELHSIADVTVAGCGSGSPCIGATFGPTKVDVYWSSTTRAIDPTHAWFVDFSSGFSDESNKSDFFFVRAVRGGS